MTIPITIVVLRWIAAFLAAILATWVALSIMGGLAYGVRRLSGAADPQVLRFAEMAVYSVTMIADVAAASVVGSIIVPPHHRRLAIPIFIVCFFLWMLPSALVFGGLLVIGTALAGAVLNYFALRWLWKG